MGIKYIDGNRLYRAFVAGAYQIFKKQQLLNKINVFPVPDSDTGTNLASTVKAIIEDTNSDKSISRTLDNITDSAIKGARGNSGIIFAQFLQGLKEEIGDRIIVTTQSFGGSAKRAVSHAYKAISNPVEGTMLSVLRDWAEAVDHFKDKTEDFYELLQLSYQKAKESLKETRHKLKELRRAKVVDAGAMGFVEFIHGIIQFISNGSLKKSFIKEEIQIPPEKQHLFSSEESIKFRYCTEILISGENLCLETIRSSIEHFGDSLIVAGNNKRARIHIHTNQPAELTLTIQKFGTITQQKADDMKMQFWISNQRKAPIGILTDTSCDLPVELIEKYQVYTVPVKLHVDGNLFLDKITITPDHFYKLLPHTREHPTTSQPAIKEFENAFSFLASNYDSIIALTLSGGLSGTYNSCLMASKNFPGKKITVIDSHNLSITLGLLVLRLARAIEKRLSHEEIVHQVKNWIKKTHVFLSPSTLKYLIKSGRVKPVKGLLANMLNLKPVITVDSNGKAANCGITFSGIPNRKKVIKKTLEVVRKNGLWNYAIAHVHSPETARWFEEHLTRILQRKPLFTMDISPVLGNHVGMGAAAVGVMGK